jgi:hypothetical protein
MTVLLQVPKALPPKKGQIRIGRRPLMEPKSEIAVSMKKEAERNKLKRILIS